MPHGRSGVRERHSEHGELVLVLLDLPRRLRGELLDGFPAIVGEIDKVSSPLQNGPDDFLIRRDIFNDQ